MYTELKQYLFLNNQLDLPGIGTLMIERKPAEADFASKLISPPSYSIALHHGGSGTSAKLFSWLAGALGVTERDAVIKYNDFAFGLKNQVMSGEKLEWQGIGILSKGLAGEIRFEAALRNVVTESPISAVKILRENAEHTIRVGEEEKTSSQMIRLLTLGVGKKSYWWVAALILLILSVIFIVYYFSVHGLIPAAAGNQQPVTPVTTSSQ